jgi:hypothetical protein
MTPPLSLGEGQGKTYQQEIVLGSQGQYRATVAVAFAQGAWHMSTGYWMQFTGASSPQLPIAARDKHDALSWAWKNLEERISALPNGKVQSSCAASDWNHHRDLMVKKIKRKREALLQQDLFR